MYRFRADQPEVLLVHPGLSNLTSPERIVRRYVKWFRPVFPLRFLNMVPLSHMFGQALTMFLLPLVPAVTMFMRSYSPHEIVKQIRTCRISVAVVVPKLLEVLRGYVLQQFPEAAQAPPKGIHWTRRWRRYRKIHSHFGWKFWAFVSGGAPLDPELEEFWSGLGFPVIQGCGLTETAPIVAFNNPFAVKKGTVGRPVEGSEIKIAEDGEILVRGECVSPGYYNAPAEAAAAFRDGWLHTGDICSIDDTGRLTIRGRKKEVIVTPEGPKIFPEDIERVLNAIAGVRESAVVGKEHPHAVLVLDPALSPDEIIRLANAALEDHQKIRGFSVWLAGRLPRTSGTEKIKRGELQYWVDTGSSVFPRPSGSDLVGTHKYAPGRAISANMTLEELGLTRSTESNSPSISNNGSIPTLMKQ